MIIFVLFFSIAIVTHVGLLIILFYCVWFSYCFHLKHCFLLVLLLFSYFFLSLFFSCRQKPGTNQVSSVSYLWFLVVLSILCSGSYLPFFHSLPLFTAFILFYFIRFSIRPYSSACKY
jgi:hypothetical protein